VTNLISFYDQVTHLVDEGKAVNVTCLDLSKTFDMVSHIHSPREASSLWLRQAYSSLGKAGWMAEPRELW